MIEIQGLCRTIQPKAAAVPKVMRARTVVAQTSLFLAGRSVRQDSHCGRSPLTIFTNHRYAPSDGT